MQKSEVRLPLTNTKINKKWIRDLSERAKTTKLLEGKHELNLYNLELGNGS